jgi:GntP family gluconate:H+ symporter
MDPLVLLGVGVVVVIGGILFLKLHAFVALLLGALAVGILTPEAAIEACALAKGLSAEAAAALAKQSVGTRIAGGFGSTCAKIGILIALASIIGRCLLESGGADRIVRSSVGLLGTKKAPVAFLGSGFTLGIPVFFDTVFYLMVPLAKAMHLRTGGKYLLYILSITAGASMAHSLVPPTPGPLYVAEELKVDIGYMIIAGGAVGIVAATMGFLYASWASRRWEIPLRDGADFSRRELDEMTARDESELPPLWLSLLPIVLPVALIAGATVANLPRFQIAEADSAWQSAFKALGEKNIALALAATVAMLTFAFRKTTTRDGLAKSVGAALQGAGVIILITASGGAFGQILQQTGIGSRIEELAATYQIGIIPLAFGVTTLIRTAQGSATVAMITATGILAGTVDAMAMDFHPVYVALAIGCGSKPFQWMNDSGFWVVCKMSGMTEKEGLKTLTPMLAIMGLSGLIVVMIAAKLLPLV